MIPVSGSAYSYSYATLGEFVAWFIGWNLILEYLFAARDGRGRLVRLCREPARTRWASTCPTALTNAPFAKGTGHFEIVRTGALINLPAVLVVAAITALCYVGIHQSARFNSIVVAIKVAVIVLFIGFGVWFVDGANWHPFIPPNTGHVRPLRLERRRARGRHHLLRLHRLRCGLDRRAGSEESAARHADRHPGEPRHLHGALRRGVGGADRHGAVHRARHAGAGRARARALSRARAGSRARSSSARSPA